MKISNEYVDTIRKTHARVKRDNSNIKGFDGRSLRYLSVDFFHQDNFTVCILHNNGKGEYVGVAKRMPEDPFDVSVGETLALSRAYRNYVLS